MGIMKSLRMKRLRKCNVSKSFLEISKKGKVYPVEVVDNNIYNIEKVLRGFFNFLYIYCLRYKSNARNVL